MEIKLKELWKAYKEFCEKEYANEFIKKEERQNYVNFIAGKSSLAYTELGDENEYSCHIIIHPVETELLYYLNEKLIKTFQYNSKEDMLQDLRYATFDDIISDFYNYIPEYNKS